MYYIDPSATIERNQHRPRRAPSVGLCSSYFIYSDGQTDEKNGTHSSNRFRDDRWCIIKGGVTGAGGCDCILNPYSHSPNRCHNFIRRASGPARPRPSRNMFTSQTPQPVRLATVALHGTPETPSQASVCGDVYPNSHTMFPIKFELMYMYVT